MRMSELTAAEPGFRTRLRSVRKPVTDLRWYPYSSLDNISILARFLPPELEKSWTQVGASRSPTMESPSMGLSGSLRRGSYNAAVLRAAGSLMPSDSELRIESI